MRWHAVFAALVVLAGTAVPCRQAAAQAWCQQPPSGLAQKHSNYPVLMECRDALRPWSPLTQPGKHHIQRSQWYRRSFIVLCYIINLWDLLPISFKVIYDCPSASEVTLKSVKYMGKIDLYQNTIIRFQNTTKHTTVSMINRIYCTIAELRWCIYT